VIECRGVTLRAGTFALHDITVAVPRGAYATLGGPTGSGKTTLIEGIAGIGSAQIVHGSVHLDGADVTRVPPERRGVGLVPQRAHLFPHLDVAANVRYGARDATLVTALLERFGIGALTSRVVGALSGGERQIVALCRALATRPRVLLLDEPYAALDPARRAVVAREVAELHDAWELTTLHVTHAEHEAREVADIALAMRDGAITRVSGA